MTNQEINPNEIQHKSFGILVKELSQEAGQEGIIEAYVSVFGNVDLHGEVVTYEAVAKSLQIVTPNGVYMHDHTEPIARTLESEAMQKGDERLPESLRPFGALYVKAQFNLETNSAGVPMNPTATRSYSDLKFGIVKEFSIGYFVKQSLYDSASSIRYLTDVEIFEWSPVFKGANPLTELQSVKEFGEKEGRKLSTATLNELNVLKENLTTAISTLDNLLTVEESKESDNSTTVFGSVLTVTEQFKKRKLL